MSIRPCAQIPLCAVYTAAGRESFRLRVTKGPISNIEWQTYKRGRRLSEQRVLEHHPIILFPNLERPEITDRVRMTRMVFFSFPCPPIVIHDICDCVINETHEIIISPTIDGRRVETAPRRATGHGHGRT